jgi:hypothetical protein
MNIPEGVNWLEFYKTATKQGVKITSRYIGVYCNINNNGAPSWMARYQGGGKSVFLGRFQFTKEGELAASKKYERYLIDNNIKPRYDEKKKYKTKHP